MVVFNKAILRCMQMFMWAVLFTGCWLTTIYTNAETVVIHAQRETLDNIPPGVVRRQGISLENCADACAKETEINCKYFKYLNDSRICLLSATDNPRVNRLASQVAAAGGLGKKSAGAWIAELQEKIDELVDEESDIENLKTSVRDLRDEIKMLRRSRISEAHRYRASKEAQQQAYTQLTRKIVGLKVDGEKFKAAVHALSNMQRVLAKEIGGLKDEQKDVLLKVAELEKSAGDLNTLTASLKATDNALQRELDSIKDGTNDLASKFSKLRDRINQEIANKQMPPGMLKLKHNQGALATALESMTDKVSSLMGRLPFMEKELRGTNQKVANQALYERELQSKLKVLYRNLLDVKKSVHNLMDPRSTVNMERAKGVLKLKSDVSMLAEMDKGLKNELQDQRDDMARLVKDVARVQLMAQNLKDKLTLVLTASRQFQQDIATLKDGQKNGLSVVEVAQMQKQVLVALNRLKTREAILMKQLNKYRASVKRVASQVSKSSSKKTKTHRVVTQLQRRLGRFEKQMQLLFARTNALQLRMKKPRNIKGMSSLLRSQAQSNANVMDLLRQLQAMRKRVSMLSIDLTETKKETEAEKRQIAEEIRLKQRQMRQKQKQLKNQAAIRRQIQNAVLRRKAKAMRKRGKKSKKLMKKRLRKEKKKKRKEKKKTRKLQKKNRKLRRKQKKIGRKKKKLVKQIKKKKKQVKKKKKQIKKEKKKVKKKNKQIKKQKKKVKKKKKQVKKEKKKVKKKNKQIKKQKKKVKKKKKQVKKEKKKVKKKNKQIKKQKKKVKKKKKQVKKEKKLIKKKNKQIKKQKKKVKKKKKQVKKEKKLIKKKNKQIKKQKKKVKKKKKQVKKEKKLIKKKKKQMKKNKQIKKKKPIKKKKIKKKVKKGKQWKKQKKQWKKKKKKWKKKKKKWKKKEKKWKKKGKKLRKKAKGKARTAVIEKAVVARPKVDTIILSDDAKGAAEALKTIDAAAKLAKEEGKAIIQPKAIGPQKKKKLQKGKGKKRWKGKGKGKGKGKIRRKGKGKGKGKMRRKGKGKGKGKMRRKGKGKGKGKIRRKGKGKGKGKIRRKGKGKGKGKMWRKGKGKGKGKMRRKGKGKMQRKGKGKGKGKMQRKGKGKGKGKMQRKGKGKGKGKMRHKGKGKGKGKMRHKGKGKGKGKMRHKGKGKGKGKMGGKGKGKKKKGKKWKGKNKKKKNKNKRSMVTVKGRMEVDNENKKPDRQSLTGVVVMQPH